MADIDHRGVGGYAPPSALLLQDLVTLIAGAPLEAISKEDFKEFRPSTGVTPTGLSPRQRMRLKFGGEAFWDWRTEAQGPGGVAAVDEVTSNLVHICAGT